MQQVLDSSRTRFSSEYDELHALIAETPADTKVKGMFVDSFLKSLDRERFPRPTTKRFVPFSDYPLRDWMNMMLVCTSQMHPNMEPKEGLRRIGQLGYPTLISSTVGKVIFAMAGRNWAQALALSKKAYSISMSRGSASLEDLTEHSAVLKLRDVWNFCETYQVGVYEGAMESFHVEGTVTARRLERTCDVDLHLEWV